MAKKNYLNNEDLMREIHRSKNTYCEFLEPQYAKYHHIVEEPLPASGHQEALKEVTDEVIDGLVAKAATKGEDIKPEDVVIRLMTNEHIPIDNNRKRRNKLDDGREKVPFPPFKHFIKKDGQFKEVGRSFWVGGFANGHFSNTHGRMTNELAIMLCLLCEKFAKASNWRGYTYNEEFVGAAKLQMVQVGLKYNEYKTQQSGKDNPFGFFSMIIDRCFKRVLQEEKKEQRTKDNLLIKGGQLPSFARQMEDEDEQRAAAGGVVLKAKPGRPRRKPA